MKRILLLTLLPLLLLGLTSCTFSTAEYYSHAQLYLGSGDFETAALMFNQLGEYEDSANYALYCAGLQALAEGNLALAQADLTQVHPFKSSARYLSLIEARTLESTGDLEGALALYAALGSFEDSHLRTESLREAIPERDLAHARALMGASRWEQALTILEGLDGYGNSAELAAQCRDALAQSAYDQASQLYDNGQYEEALSAFEALGDSLDARQRAQMCRSAMYAQLEEDYLSASMATAEDLMARYAEMEDYLQSAARLKDLQRRFAVNLALAKAVYQRPWVHFGQRMDGSAPLAWRLILAEGSQVTLLYQDTAIFASTTDLAADFSTHPAVVSFVYPRLTLDLDKFSFTQGGGTADDPFQ